MDRRAFEAVVEQALRRLPAEFRRRLENVAVLVEAEPSPDLLRGMGVPPRDTLLGVYQGTPYPQRGVTTYGNVLPDRIVLFQRPIEAMGGGEGAIRRRIAETVVHEIGHYFGLSDDEMDDAEEEMDETFDRVGADEAASAREGGDPDDGDPEEEEDDDDLDEDEDDLDDDDLDEDEDDLDDEDEPDDDDLDDDDLGDDDDLDDEDEDEDEPDDDLEDDAGDDEDDEDDHH